METCFSLKFIQLQRSWTLMNTSYIYMLENTVSSVFHYVGMMKIDRALLRKFILIDEWSDIRRISMNEVRTAAVFIFVVWTQNLGGLVEWIVANLSRDWALGSGCVHFATIAWTLEIDASIMIFAMSRPQRCQPLKLSCQAVSMAMRVMV
jgi:hypothetical protein